MRYLVLLLLFCCGCASHSLEDFQAEGQRIAVQLTRELQSIHTRDELVQAAPRITALFDKLVDVAIAGHQYRQEHAWEEMPELTREQEQVNVRLQMELARVCGLEGGRDIILKCQECCLNRLDFSTSRSKKSLLAE